MNMTPCCFATKSVGSRRMSFSCGTFSFCHCWYILGLLLSLLTVSFCSSGIEGHISHSSRNLSLTVASSLSLELKHCLSLYKKEHNLLNSWRVVCS